MPRNSKEWDISSTGAQVVQPESAVRTIGKIYQYGPIIVWSAAVLILLVYKLDKMYPQIERDLLEREIKTE